MEKKVLIEFVVTSNSSCATIEQFFEMLVKEKGAEKIVVKVYKLNK